MRKLTILVDMDDTLEHLMQGWCEALNERYGTNVTVEECRDWDVGKAFPTLTHDQVYNIILEPGFWDRVQPVEGAKEVLERFIAQGHKIYVATATPFICCMQKFEKALFNYYPFFDFTNVVVIWNKKLLKGDVLIDDGPHNLEGGDYEKILIDMPYNRAYDAEANGMKRVHNWAEIEEAVNEIANR